MVAQPRAPIGSVLKQGFLYKGVEDNLKIDVVDDMLKISGEIVSTTENNSTNSFSKSLSRQSLFFFHYNKNVFSKEWVKEMI